MMKKISLITAVVIFLVMLMSPASFASSVLYGDTDGDGNIAVSDARLALRGAIGLEEWIKDSTSSFYLAADADRDGAVTVSDARLILRAAIGLEQIEQPEEINTVPAQEFNGRVNVLKAHVGDYRFSTVEKNTVYCGNPVYGGGLKNTMKSFFDSGIKEMQTPETSWKEPVTGRALTKGNFCLKGNASVSEITDDDVESIISETVSGKVFADEILPVVIERNGTKYDITAFTSFSGSELEKITVTLKPEEITEGVIPAVERIYGDGYKAVAEEIASYFSDVSDLTDRFASSQKLSVKCTVVYWFDAESSLPVAACYKCDVTVDFRAEIKGITQLDSGTFSLPFYSNTADYYMFSHIN